jgi:hypothetical protein
MTSAAEQPTAEHVRRTIRPAPWRSSRVPAAVRKIGPSQAVAVLDGQRFDVGADGFGNPQAVEGEQGD